MEKLWWVARLDFTASFLALIVTSKIHRVPCFSAAVTTTTRMSTSQEWVKVSTLGWSRYKLWQSIWQSATLQTALKACFHFVTFAALDTLSLPSTWTETWASLAIEYCWGSWDLCFLCLWGKPLISCFVRSSLKLIFSCFLWPRVAPWNYFKTNLLKMAMFKKKKKLNVVVPPAIRVTCEIKRMKLIGSVNAPHVRGANISTTRGFSISKLHQCSSFVLVQEIVKMNICFYQEMVLPFS